MTTLIFISRCIALIAETERDTVRPNYLLILADDISPELFRRCDNMPYTHFLDTGRLVEKKYP